MIRPLLSLERLSFLEREGKVGYRWDQDRAGQEMMDYLELIGRVVSPIPDKGQVTVRSYGLYANAHRGKVRKASLSPLVLRMAEEARRPIVFKQVFRSSGTRMSPANPAHANFLVLDFDPRSGLSFFREGCLRF